MWKLIAVLLGGAALCACAPPSGPARSPEACLTNRTDSVVAFTLQSKLPNEGWTNSAGVAKLVAGGRRVCVGLPNDAWPRQVDTAFVVGVGPRAHEPPLAQIGCGEVAAGDTPRAAELELEFVNDDAAGLVCRMSASS